MRLIIKHLGRQAQTVIFFMLNTGQLEETGARLTSTMEVRRRSPPAAHHIDKQDFSTEKENF